MEDAVFSIVADNDSGFFIWVGTETAPKMRCLKYTLTLWGARRALRRLVRNSSRLDRVVEQVRVGSGNPLSPEHSDPTRRSEAQ